MNSFAVCYIESNIACVLVFGVLLIHNHFNPDREASMKLRAARGDRIKAIPNPLQKAEQICQLPASTTIRSRVI